MGLLLVPLLERQAYGVNNEVVVWGEALGNWEARQVPGVGSARQIWRLDRILVY